MSYWANFWDIFWWFLSVYAFLAFLYALFAIIGDIFRDQLLSGWVKALWIVLLAVFPFVSVLMYLIARGRGMTMRSLERARQESEAADDHIRKVASASPSEEISKAKVLLDAGTITPAEFDKIKSSVLV